MMRETERLEHLMTRFLDGEISVAERAELDDVLRTDPAARALWHETSRLDTLAGDALRAELRPMIRRPAATPIWLNLARWGAVCAAACVAAVVWLGPARPAGDRLPGIEAARASSWFAPPPGWGDTYTAQPAVHSEVAEYKIDPPRFLVIPGARPGEYLVVETRSVPRRVTPPGRGF